jgi:hypothetical protein
MLVVDEIPAKEFAKSLGMSVNSVYIAKSRILKRLLDKFEDLIDDKIPGTVPAFSAERRKPSGEKHCDIDDIPSLTGVLAHFR